MEANVKHWMIGKIGDRWKQDVLEMWQCIRRCKVILEIKPIKRNYEVERNQYRFSIFIKSIFSRFGEGHVLMLKLQEM